MSADKATTPVIPHDDALITMALKEEAIAEKDIPWAQQVIGLDRDTFRKWLHERIDGLRHTKKILSETRELLASDSARPDGNRERLIASAIREYDAQPREILATGCTRVQYINQTLREGGCAALTPDELLLVPARGAGQPAVSLSESRFARQRIIAEACAEFDGQRTQVTCSRHQWIDQTLLDAGLPTMTDSEKGLILDRPGCWQGEAVESGRGSPTPLSETTLGRARTIADAAAQFDRERKTVICCKHDYIDETLREAGLPPMMESEKRMILNVIGGREDCVVAGGLS